MEKNIAKMNLNPIPWWNLAFHAIWNPKSWVIDIGRDHNT